MSQNKTHRPQNNGPYTPNNNSAKKESSDCRVFIEHGVKIDLVEDLRTKNEARHNETSTQQRKQLRWTKIGAIFVIIYTLLMGYQSCLFKSANEINRQALISVQRAFVTFQGFEISPSDNTAGEHFWDYQPKYENSGNTPAINTMSSFECGLLPTEPTQQQFERTGLNVLGKPEFNTNTIGPKNSVNGAPWRAREIDVVGGNIGNDSLPSNYYESHGIPFLHRDRRVGFYCWGWIVYKDILPETKPHLTEFCTHLSAMVLDFKTKTINQRFAGCSNYNCTDENCPNYNQVLKFTEYK